MLCSVFDSINNFRCTCIQVIYLLIFPKVASSVVHLTSRSGITRSAKYFHQFHLNFIIFLCHIEHSQWDGYVLEHEQWCNDMNFPMFSSTIPTLNLKIYCAFSDTWVLETDDINPLNKYGQSKADAEKVALQVNPKSLVLRTTVGGATLSGFLVISRRRFGIMSSDYVT